MNISFLTNKLINIKKIKWFSYIAQNLRPLCKDEKFNAFSYSHPFVRFQSYLSNIDRLANVAHITSNLYIFSKISIHASCLNKSFPLDTQTPSWILHKCAILHTVEITSWKRHVPSRIFCEKNPLRIHLMYQRKQTVTPQVEKLCTVSKNAMQSCELIYYI